MEFFGKHSHDKLTLTVVYFMNIKDLKFLNVPLLNYFRIKGSEVLKIEI